MGYLLNELLMVGSMGELIMSVSEYVFLSTLMISIVMKYNIFWSVYLDSVSALVEFPVSVVLCNHVIASVMTLLNWL